MSVNIAPDKAGYRRLLRMIVVNTRDEDDRKWAKEEYRRVTKGYWGDEEE